MPKYYHRVKDKNEILQGDVFKVGENCNSIFSKDEQYAVLITADCDISQKKMGNYYTFLPIISARDYIEKYWLVELFRNQKKRIIEQACVELNNSKTIADSKCDKLTFESLDRWLKQKSLSYIFKISEIDINKKNIKFLIEKYEIISNDVSLKNYFKFNACQNKREKGIKNEMISSIKNSRQEFYYVPDINHPDSLGVIIKLRDIRAVHQDLVIKDKFSARLSKNGLDSSLIRVGKFSDYLRFSITQNFALIFTKIGMPSVFEEDVFASLDILTDHLWSSCNDN